MFTNIKLNCTKENKVEKNANCTPHGEPRKAELALAHSRLSPAHAVRSRGVPLRSALAHDIGHRSWPWVLDAPPFSFSRAVQPGGFEVGFEVHVLQVDRKLLRTLDRGVRPHLVRVRVRARVRILGLGLGLKLG